MKTLETLAWLIIRADGKREVILSPLTDETYLGEGDEAIALCSIIEAETPPMTPDGYSVVMKDGAFVGIWKDIETAEKVRNRSQATTAQERIEPMIFSSRLIDASSHCDECDWTYGCFNGSAPCSKKPARSAKPPKRWCTVSYRHQPHDSCDGSPAHYPEEWGPSNDRRLTCSCGNPDPDHMNKAANNIATLASKRKDGP